MIRFALGAVMRLGGRYWACVLAGVLIAGAGCAKAPTDSQLGDQIRAKFKQDSGLQEKTIGVEISKGVVTLSGTVDNDAERSAASRYASTTPGIKEVVNNLQVAPAAAIVEPAATPAQTSTAPLPASQASATTAQAKPSAAPRRKGTDNSSRQLASSSQTTTAGAPVGDFSTAKIEPSDAPEQIAAKAQPPQESADTPPDAPPAPARASEPKLMTVEAGTSLAVRLVDDLDSESAAPGQKFRATLDSPLASEWDVAIPAGYDVEGHVVEVKSAGKFAGRAQLVVTLDRILVGGKSYDIQTDDYRRQGKSQATKTATKVGAGATIGAIIGGIAGGGKGAGIGAAAGGGVGGAAQTASKPEPVRLPSETVLNFRLQSPVTVTQVEEGPGHDRRQLKPKNE
ncbi:MAG TPA: BON domain-containing protein [Terriglobales bacterium]|nr:BON domain-containing protein [Terriglobales bacterium]